ncbi:MAG: hypothetical protein PVH87_25830 [Desulfobacteraceae bacterium]|jgi:intracellular multiplication protein IcmB
MGNKFTDKMFYQMDNLMRGMSDWIAASIDHNCMLETCDSDHALSASSGALVTLFEYSGALSQIGKEDFNDIITGLDTALKSKFNTSGRALQIVYHYDPKDIKTAVEKITRPCLTTARNLKLDLEDFIKEWNQTVSKYCSVERCYIAAWTRPDVLPPNERKRAFKKMGKACVNSPAAPKKQLVGHVMSDIRHKHDGFVEALQESFKNQGLFLEKLSAHRALWHIRRITCPEFTGAEWKALLPGDPLPRTYPDPGEKDYYGLLYPSIAEQLFPREGEQIDSTTIRIGDTIHKPLVITAYPQNPKPFQSLFRFLSGKGVPWRMSMLIEPDGLAGMNFKNIIASILAFTSSDNKRFKNAVDALKEASLNGETIVKLKIVFDTWTSVHTPDALEVLSGQASVLSEAVQAWGTCDTTESIGDPLLGVCATIPAMMDRSPAPAAAPPLKDVIKMVPMRPLSVWQTGSLLLRTPDGKLMPYAPLSSLQASWIELGGAPMGGGKSVFLSTINLAFVLQPGLVELPLLSMLEIGPTSKGMIYVIRDALPPHLRHLAAYHRLKMTPQYAINPFDTPLGCRKPLPSHISFLVNLLSLFATPLDKTAPGDGVAGLARMAVDRSYNLLADDDGATPKPYTPGFDKVVDELVTGIDVTIDKDTSWWEVVDALFDAGYTHEATRAQRYAVPLLSDIIGACQQSEDIKKMYTEELVNHFTRCLSESIQAYPILKEPTRFDIGDARIVSLDLDEVAPRGGAVANRQTAVMYMLARYVLAAKFYLRPEDAASMPQRYRQYQYKRIKEIFDAPKRLACDEVHRVSKLKAVVNQFMDDLETQARETRKWKISYGLYSQHFNDYPEIIIELATTIIVLGKGTKKSANWLCDTFGFNSVLRHSLNNLSKPGPKGANFVALMSTSKGDVYQTLTNTISPMAIWAFSSTKEDMTVRDALFEKLGVKKTLKLLAKHWPGGIQTEAERRRRLFEESGLDQEAKNVEATLIDELLEQVKIENI